MPADLLAPFVGRCAFLEVHDLQDGVLAVFFLDSSGAFRGGTEGFQVDGKIVSARRSLLLRGTVFSQSYYTPS